jgi:dihydroneopterin triphosphate diphosphatase
VEILSKMIEAHVFREIGDELEFLLLKRSDKVIYPGLWQMVNGKIKEGEKGYQTALREIKEETGLNPERLWVVPNVNSFYSHETDNIMLLPVFAAKVNESTDVVISDEHCDFKWLNSNNSKEMLAWPGQRKSVDLIVNYFKKEINFLDLVEIRI